MKEFWKDYGELWKESWKFTKKHWKGLLILNAAVCGAEVAWFTYKSKQLSRTLAKDLSEETED